MDDLEGLVKKIKNEQSNKNDEINVKFIYFRNWTWLMEDKKLNLIKDKN